MNTGGSVLLVPPVRAVTGREWHHLGAPGFMVVGWMGNHAGCEPAGMGVMGSGGQQSQGNSWFSGEQGGRWSEGRFHLGCLARISKMVQ